MTIDEMIAVLQAAKEGKEIQTRVKDSGMGGDWTRASRPLWDFYHRDYRVKPEVLRYRVALFRYDTNAVDFTVCTDDMAVGRLERHEYFVRWLTDWQEVEV